MLYIKSPFISAWSPNGMIKFRRRVKVERVLPRIIRRAYYALLDLIISRRTFSPVPELSPISNVRRFMMWKISSETPGNKTVMEIRTRARFRVQAHLHFLKTLHTYEKEENLYKLPTNSFECYKMKEILLSEKERPTHVSKRMSSGAGSREFPVGKSRTFLPEMLNHHCSD